MCKCVYNVVITTQGEAKCNLIFESNTHPHPLTYRLQSSTHLYSHHLLTPTTTTLAHMYFLAIPHAVTDIMTKLNSN